MAAHPSILTWRVPWTEEPAGCRPRGRKTDLTEQSTAPWVYVDPKLLT